MAEIVIKAAKREKTGKGNAHKLRNSGKIPANLLEKGKSTPLELDPKMLSKAWQAGKTFTLDLDGTTKAVLIKELQLDPVKRVALHVDLVYAP